MSRSTPNRSGTRPGGSRPAGRGPTTGSRSTASRSAGSRPAGGTSTSRSAAAAAEPARSLRAPGRVLLGAALVAGLTLAAVLTFGGGAAPTTVPGLPEPGALTRWGVPAMRVLVDGAAIVTIGLLLAAVFLVPTPRAGSGSPVLPATGRRCVRAASATALVWAASAVLSVPLVLSDLAGVPVSGLGSLQSITDFVMTVPQGRALLAMATIAALVAPAARFSSTVGTAALTLVLAMAGLIPPVLTGHSAAAAGHGTAVTSLGFHVLAVSVWAGGLVGLLVVLAAQPRLATSAVPRFSLAAGWAAAAVGLSGLVNAAVRVGDLAGLSSGYAVFVLVKVAVFAGLIGMGAVHRRRLVPALVASDAAGRAERIRVFVRLASVEVLLMGAAVGLAVGLSRTPTPQGDAALGSSAAETLLGYPMPPEPTAWRLLTETRLDLFFLVLSLLALGLYAAGLIRLRRTGIRWPVGRTLAWTGGWLLTLLATQSGLATYSPLMFSVHMVQHMTLSMLVPILLVLGGPITLALRALPAAGHNDPRGPREWLLAALHSRVASFFGNPLVAFAIFVTAPFMVYGTSLFEIAMRGHATHVAMMLHFLLGGYLFFWVIIGIDPAPRRVPYPARMVMLLGAMAFHAMFGVAMMMAGTVIAEDWYRSLGRPWGGSLLADQGLGGGIAWAFGELPSLVVLAALFVQWVRSDERAARRHDRREDAGNDDSLERYNAYLAGLAEQDERQSR